MKKIITLLLILALPYFAQSLSKAYVLSEGAFSPGTAMLSMLDLNTSGYAQNIFSPGNIGLYANGLIIHEDNLYLMEQGGFGGPGKIYKLDTLGNVSSSAIVGTNPYSLAVANSKIYITNGPASSVSVLNMNDLSFVKEISVGVYPQEILSHNNRVYVANTSLFGGSEDSTVSVISAETDEVVNTIFVKKDPSSLALSQDGHLLIGCTGDASIGIIYKVELNNFTKVDSFIIPGYGFGKDISVDITGSKVYFLSYSNAIIELDLTSRSVAPVVDDPSLLFVYGYAFDYENKTHYLLDAKNFVTNGSLNIYNSAGSKLSSFETGIAPRRVLLKYNIVPTSVKDFDKNLNFSLQQNFPNPFNPVKKIRFVIPSNSSNVYGGSASRLTNLNVYDLLGTEVSTLFDKPTQAGTYEVEFDATDLPSGIYFYKLSTGNFTETKKMILVK